MKKQIIIKHLLVIVAVIILVSCQHQKNENLRVSPVSDDPAMTQNIVPAG